jgi:hypothetical protein
VYTVEVVIAGAKDGLTEVLVVATEVVLL